VTGASSEGLVGLVGVLMVELIAAIPWVRKNVLTIRHRAPAGTSSDEGDVTFFAKIGRKVMRVVLADDGHDDTVVTFLGSDKGLIRELRRSIEICSGSTDPIADRN
jgi:hypothetical protein